MDSSVRKRRGAGHDGIAARETAPELTRSARRQARCGHRTPGAWSKPIWRGPTGSGRSRGAGRARRDA